MGGGAWSSNVYNSTTRVSLDSGTNFSYSRAALDPTAPPSAKKVHENLDPMNLKVRESRDSDEHPTSVAIGVAFDVTGSMHHVPAQMQKNLPSLMTMLLTKGVIEHPQICMAAIGDAMSDMFPFQIGQFESDNRIDENLDNIILEGNGGGQYEESYDLALYAFARKTSIDCFEKRGEKGYLFLTGDEKARDVSRHLVQKVFGDDLEADIPFADILREAQEKYEVFFLIPNAPGLTMHGTDPVLHDFWRKHLGQNVIMFSDPDAISEVIAVAIAACEGIDIGTAGRSLVEVGSDANRVSVATTALSHYSAPGKVAVVGSDLTTDGSASVERL